MTPVLPLQPVAPASKVPLVISCPVGGGGGGGVVPPDGLVNSSRFGEPLGSLILLAVELATRALVTVAGLAEGLPCR